jgi:energy-coupling factor transporter transmembrane protein EcfT
MEIITGFIAEHPSLMIMLLIFLIIMLLYFIFKKLIKLILILMLVLFAVGGFFIIKDPNNLQKSVELFKSGMTEIKEKTTGMYEDLKELFYKGKEMPGNINEMLEDSKEQADKL